MHPPSLMHTCPSLTPVSHSLSTYTISPMRPHAPPCTPHLSITGSRILSRLEDRGAAAPPSCTVAMAPEPPPPPPPKPPEAWCCRSPGLQLSPRLTKSDRPLSSVAVEAVPAAAEESSAVRNSRPRPREKRPPRPGAGCGDSRPNPIAAAVAAAAENLTAAAAPPLVVPPVPPCVPLVPLPVGLRTVGLRTLPLLLGQRGPPPCEEDEAEESADGMPP